MTSPHLPGEATDLPDALTLERIAEGSGHAPQFRYPWEARAFAMVVCLAEAGHITWREWVETLARHVASATSDAAQGGRPRSYYEQWVGAAEELLVQRHLTSADQLRARRLGAWPLDMSHQSPVRQ